MGGAGSISGIKRIGVSMKHLFTAAIALALASFAHSAETTKYVALVNGGKSKAGHLITTESGGKYKVDYLFKNNGRGPELKEEYTLAPDGTFARYKVTGATTFGSLVNETFSRSGDSATWKSTSDKGEQKVDGTALYLPLGSSPQAFSVALTALYQRPDRKLPMIPSGTLTVRKLLDAEVTRGAQKQQVQLLAITGIGFTPTSVWATTGEKPRLFAYIYPGFLQLIEEGWESNAASMET